MIDKDSLSLIGKFQKTHALKGELNAILDVPQDFIEEGNPLIVETDGILVPFFVSTIRPKGNTTVLVKLDGIDSEEEAKTFVNKPIYALKDKLKSFYKEEDEDLMDSDSLEGFSIIDSGSGEEIGKIVKVDDSTTNILLHVETAANDIVFIPLAEDWISEIDPDKRIIEMILPDGLIDLNLKL